MSEFRFRKKTKKLLIMQFNVFAWPSEEHMSHIFVIQYFRLVIDSKTIYASDRFSNDITFGKGGGGSNISGKLFNLLINPHSLYLHTYYTFYV